MADFDPEGLDFSTGTDLITQKCQPCKEGRHFDCRSLDRNVRENTYPFFEDDEPRSNSGWECGCLIDATTKKNFAKHEGVLE